MGHGPASVGRVGSLRFLVPLEPQDIEKKLFHKGIDVGQTKQVIQYSGSGRGFSNQINEFIHY